jgi:hypothetical protein
MSFESSFRIFLGRSAQPNNYLDRPVGVLRPGAKGFGRSIFGSFGGWFFGGNGSFGRAVGGLGGLGRVSGLDATCFGGFARRGFGNVNRGGFGGTAISGSIAVSDESACSITSGSGSTTSIAMCRSWRFEFPSAISPSSMNRLDGRCSLVLAAANPPSSDGALRDFTTLVGLERESRDMDD